MRGWERENKQEDKKVHKNSGPTISAARSGEASGVIERRVDD